MQFNQLLSLPQLRDRFGAVTGHESAISTTEKDLVGPHYRELLRETTEIVSHQWRSGIRRGAIKGFFLSGPPGIGKTSLAMRVAYELNLRFVPESADAPAEGSVVLALIEIGRAHV